MGRIIVTSGKPFIDIDGLACIVAYTELLQKEGKKALAVTTSKLNVSVTDTVRNWQFILDNKFEGTETKFAIVDVSDPEKFDDLVAAERVIEIYDHHFGFEKYWQEKLEKNSHIEKIGACATLIWEEFKKRNQDKKISEVSANFLYTAILSNTLNFKASVTDQRDLQAFNELKKYISLPENWTEQYFTEQEKYIYKNPKKAIESEIKEFPFLKSKDLLVIGQMELWDSHKFITKYQKQIENTLMSFGSIHWFMTSPSISEGKNYLFSKNPEIKKLLEKIIDAKFDGDIGTTNKLWLRKEILAKISRGAR